MLPAERPAPGLEFVVRRGLAARLDRVALRRVAAAVLAQEGLPAGSQVTLIVVGETAIRRLNKRFRSIDRSTDVLSFPLESEGFALPPDEPRHLGDVVLCHPIALRQAEEYGHAPEREIAYLFAHGLLHLLGYDHEVDEEQADMRMREERALGQVGLTR